MVIAYCELTWFNSRSAVGFIYFISVTIHFVFVFLQFTKNLPVSSNIDHSVSTIAVENCLHFLLATVQIFEKFAFWIANVFGNKNMLLVWNIINLSCMCSLFLLVFSSCFFLPCCLPTNLSTFRCNWPHMSASHTMMTSR